jgi:hypothetical protein
MGKEGCEKRQKAKGRRQKKERIIVVRLLARNGRDSIAQGAAQRNPGVEMIRLPF